MEHQQSVGLVLTGGGARGAYQAGALKAVCEIVSEWGIKQPFPIISGVSAGAINATYLASHAEDMGDAVIRLADLWGGLTTDQIFKVDPLTIGKTTLRLVLELTSGRFARVKRVRSLLNTQPLRELIERETSFRKMSANIDSGLVRGIVITAINYSNGLSSNFYQSQLYQQPWQKSRRVGERTQITSDHVMASSAIPIFFPPIQVGSNYYGDGSVRLYTPLSAALRLGANKLFVIAVRRGARGGDNEDQTPFPTLGRVVSVLLNSVLLDAIDLDYERLTRINHTLSLLPESAETTLKPVEVCMIRPSEDIGEIAFEEVTCMPKALRYMLRGLGTAREDEGLLSYLMFESRYTQRLLDLGYQDAYAQKEAILSFFKPN